MRNLLLTSFLIVAISTAAFTQTADDPRIELHLLRVENAKLRAAIAQLQAELDTVRLTAERAALVNQLRKELKPPEGSEFDWTAKAFVPPKEVK